MKPRSRSRLPLQYYACVLWTGKFRRPGRGVVCEYRKQLGPLRAHLTTGDDHASCPYGPVPPMRHARVSHPVNGNQEEHPLSTIDRQEPRLGIPDTTETQATTTPAFTRAIPSPCINPLTTTGTNSNHDHSDDTTPAQVHPYSGMATRNSTLYLCIRSGQTTKQVQENTDKSIIA